MEIFMDLNIGRTNHLEMGDLWPWNPLGFLEPLPARRILEAGFQAVAACNVGYFGRFTLFDENWELFIFGLCQISVYLFYNWNDSIFWMAVPRQLELGVKDHAGDQSDVCLPPSTNSHWTLDQQGFVAPMLEMTCHIPLDGPRIHENGFFRWLPPRMGLTPKMAKDCGICRQREGERCIYI